MDGPFDVDTPLEYAFDSKIGLAVERTLDHEIRADGAVQSSTGHV